MSSEYDDQKKRPPPINIPPVPLPRSALTTNPVQMNRSGPYQQQQQQQQRDARDASNLTQQGTNRTNSLTSPFDQNPTRFSRSRSHKSDHGSTVASQGDSTTRSRHSGRSHRSAAAAPAPLDVVDEKTTRGQMESRNERKLFKMTGQVPPTPSTGALNEDDVYIRTDDLRAECRAASGEKSPKKKLFAGINTGINNLFGRTPTHVPMPQMPSKAAQVLGTSARKPHIIEVRPIKPPGPFKTPTGVPRSDTAKSLPSKVLGPHNYAQHHHSGTSRHNRTVGHRSSDRSSKQSPDAENAPPVPEINAPRKSASPPTPPAKDTPPVHRPAALPTSPLRRAPQSEHLRESYGAHVDNSMRLQFAEFALTPLPSKTAIPENGGKSPTKFRPYTAEDYTKLIRGEPMQWPYPDVYDPSSRQEDDHSSALAAGHIQALQLTRPDRQGEEEACNSIPPRFYSPSNRSIPSFAEGETPSKNSDVNRLLFSVPSQPALLRLREDSSNGSIEMVFQGDVNDIDPHSSTAQLFSNSDHQSISPQARDSTNLATRLMQELRIGEHHAPSPQQNRTSGHLQPDQSSSRLTDMLNAVSPHRNELNGEFQPNCLSAVPSPLHKLPGSLPHSQSILASPRSNGQWGQPQTSKSVEDHFFMTNEHLDVVGKTTWDSLEIAKQQQLTAVNTKHEQLVALVERHAQDFKSQINTVNEKVDRTADKQNNIHNDIEKILSLVREEVAGPLAAQDRKATEMQTHIKELQKTVQALQNLLEQKLSEPKTAGQQHSTSWPLPAPNSSNSNMFPPAPRSQPSLAGYYGNTAELGQPPMPHVPDNRGIAPAQDGHHDQRVGYNNGYGQQWSARPGYSGRNSKEDRSPYNGTNPYHFNNGGQFSNVYAGGYSPYNFSLNPPDQHHTFNQGPTK